MKKLMVTLMAILMLVPMTNVFADEYKVYSPGEVVNFFAYEGDQNGYTTVILEDKGSSDEYVKVLLTGFALNSTSYPYQDTTSGYTGETFEKSGGYALLTDGINRDLNALDGHAKPISESGNLSTITLDDLVNIFGATPSADGETYTIDVAKWKSVFEGLASTITSGGIYTSTPVETDTTKIWTILFQKNATSQELESITVEKKPIAAEPGADGSPIVYGYVPVVYMNKKYDCKGGDTSTTTTDPTSVCYDCGEDYIWDQENTHDECTVIEKIKESSDCVKVPKTGVEEYIIEFGAIAGICAVILIIIKKKDLFRQI